jgi:hypothetical protein
MSYDQPWFVSEYCGPRTIDSDYVTEYEGFVYLITHKETGRYYLGKKSFWSRVKPKGKTRRKTIESNWKNYWGSSKEFLTYVKEEGKDKFIREIIHLCVYKKQMTYWETYEQYTRGVLFDELCFCDNIGGTMFSSEQHILKAGM